MAGLQKLNAEIVGSEADRLFREEKARRQPKGDGRLVTWIPAPKPGSDAEILSSMLWTWFGVFCVVGGMAMMLGMSAILATSVSLVTFAALRVFIEMT